MTLPSGRTLQVARQGVIEGAWRHWELQYVTSLDPEKRAPIRAEILGIWRELRPEVEKLEVDKVIIRAWDRRWRWGSRAPVLLQGDFVGCVQMQRQEDGTWKEGSWK
jgi:hypothetical protein